MELVSDSQCLSMQTKLNLYQRGNKQKSRRKNDYKQTKQHTRLIIYSIPVL